MTTRETAIDLEFWQVRGLLVMLVLAGCAAFLFFWHLFGWQHSLQKRETMLEQRALFSLDLRDRYAIAGELACLKLSAGEMLTPPQHDALWIELDDQLARQCGLAPLLLEQREPFTLADGTPLPTLTVKAEWAPRASNASATQRSSSIP